MLEISWLASRCQNSEEQAETPIQVEFQFKMLRSLSIRQARRASYSRQQIRQAHSHSQLYDYEL